MEILNAFLPTVGQGLAFIGIVYLAMLINHKWRCFTMKRRGLDFNDEVEEQSNLAVALSQLGMFVGIGLGMYGVISGPSNGFQQDLIDVGLYGALVSLFFLIARGVNEYLILGHVNNINQLKNGNIAVALVECGAYIATGVIAMSSMMGEGGGVGTAVGFFVIGQILMLLAVWAFEWITPWGVRKEIKDGNASAGLLIAGLLTALSIALHGAVSEDFVSWSYSLQFLLLEGVTAVFLMVAIKYLIDWVFLPNTTIETEVVRDRNVAAIAIVVSLFQVAALAISAAVV